MSASGRKYESVPGLWKFACALAVLFGHNLVTIVAWRPDDRFWGGVYNLVQFFSPLHFFFFSGFLAASALLDTRRRLPAMMLSRSVRIYALIFTALIWGLLARILFKEWVGPNWEGVLWPLSYWNGPLDWWQALRHVNPFGFADHVSFNYAVWYLYQEFRIVLLFPVFRWILLRRTLAGRIFWVGSLLAVATVLEYLFWSWFPLFRSSPFQTIGFGCIFAVGSLVWMELREGGILHRLGPTGASLLLGSGVILSFSESAGIRPPVDNPNILIVPTMIGQALAVAGLVRLLGSMEIPMRLRRACDASVGIYIIHPPIHLVCASIAVSLDALWPMGVGILLSILAGWLYHLWIETPSQHLAKLATSRLPQ